MPKPPSLFPVLDNYKNTVDNLIFDYFKTNFGKDSSLKSAVEYSLINGGKRFRPIIVLLVAKALKQDLHAHMAAIAVEFFHTASLIADDLPCMDNDDERRSKPTVHKVFGESIALLSTYSLIAAGYKAIHDNALSIKKKGLASSDEICLLALENAAINTGILGATGGQFLDLFPPGNTLKDLEEILNKKTATLFEISFVFGWLFGGGLIDKLPTVKKLAYHFGMAFQIADDLHDIQKDKNSERPNLPNFLGIQESILFFKQEISQTKQLLTHLNIDTQDFRDLVMQLEKLAANHP